jgi:EAL and modified HD-GYP domain-containing signal transduction protein
MTGTAQAFLGRQPIVDRDGDLVGYELLYRASGTDDRARFVDEDSASLHVLSTLLLELGASQVLAGRQAFVNVGPASLRDAGALVLLDPRRTVLELSQSIAPDADAIERVGRLREMGFGIAVAAAPPLSTVAPWLPIATHLKIDLQRVPESALAAFVAALRDGPHVLVAEKVESSGQMSRCRELGLHAMQGWHVGRPEVMGRVRLAVSHAVLRRAIRQLAGGATTAELERTIRADVALCWRLLRYVAASNFGMLVPVESLSHALDLVGPRRLARWLQLLLDTVDEPSPAAGNLMRVAALRGRVLESIGVEYFGGSDGDDLFLVGAFSLLPAMLMQPMSEAIASLALPEAVVDALTARQGRYGPLLELAEALEQGSGRKVESLCASLALSHRVLARATSRAQTAVGEPATA